MFKLKSLNYFIVVIWAALIFQGCANSGKNPVHKMSAADSTAKNHLIVAGRRLENINNDSLLIVSRKLFDINNGTDDKETLVYAQMFMAINLWQSAEHEKAMALAINCLANARKYNIRQTLPEIYGLIGNLDKETANYNMAFIAADSGLNAAVENKDTASTIALMGLKAMFSRGFNLNHRQSGPDQSIDLNLKALAIAESSPKYEKIRIRFYDNLSQYYEDQHNYDKTFYYGNKGVALALKYNQLRSLTYAYCWLGKANYFQGRQALGIDYLNKALQIAQKLNEPYRVMEIKQQFYNCYISSGNYKDAIHYYDFYIRMRDSLKVLDNVRQISELQVKYNTAEKDAKIINLNDEQKIQKLELYAALIVVALLAIISILVYIEEKKSRALLRSEKMILDTELKNATLELLYFTENLTQKNELIEEFKAKIEHLQHVNRADIEGLEQLVKEHIMTDEKWENFKRLFSKVHTTFFANLRQKYPNITATDTRMLALIKLQLGNYEISNMLGVTIEGVKKSKQRLRKKMDLQKDESLENIVDTL